MNRRKFFTSLLFAAITGVVGTVFQAVAGPVRAAPGKLGYREDAPKARQCQKCRYYKPLKEDGECTFQGMRSAMKAKEVIVKATASCSMFNAGKYKSK